MAILGFAFDPRERAEAAVRQGDLAKAAQLFARAGDFDAAAKYAFASSNEIFGTECLVRGATGKLDSTFHGVSPKQAGELLVTMGHTQHALQLFEYAREWQLAAGCAIKLKRPQQAARYYEMAGAFWDASIFYERVGQKPKALAMLDEIAKRLDQGVHIGTVLPATKSRADVDALRAQLLVELGRQEEAAKVYRALGLGTRGRELLLAKGQVLEALRWALEEGAHAEAKSLLERVPDPPIDLVLEVHRAGRDHVAVGRVLAAAGRNAEAAVAFELGGVWEEAAQQWERLREHRKAAMAWSKAGRPADAGRCFAASGAFQLAAEVWIAAGKHRPAAENYLKAGLGFEAGRSFLAAADKHAAALAFQQVPPDHPHFQSATLALAPLLLDLGQAPAAYHRLQLLSVTTKDLPERAFFEGKALEQMGRPLEAEARYRTVVAANPSFADAAQRLMNLSQQNEAQRTSALRAAPVLEPTVPGLLAGQAAQARPAPAAPASTELEIGSMLADRYEILRELGRGGMGRVYVARDQVLGEELAIKTLLRGGLGGVEEERMIREVQVCRRITHPNVVRVYDIGRWEGGLFVTMEFLDGFSLEQMVAAPVRPALSRVRQVLLDLAAGLAEAHALGIVHRDLKPQNVVVTPSRVKILDFGIARSLDRDTRLTRTGLAIGSPLYMAPEQIQGEELDGRTDLYALGGIAYALVVGREPFRGSTVTEVMMAHLSQPVPDPGAARPDLPEAWRELVTRLLAKAPVDRFESAEAVREALLGM